MLKWKLTRKEGGRISRIQDRAISRRGFSTVQVRLRLILIAIGLAIFFAWHFPGEAGAVGVMPWDIVEVPVAVSPGDQISPSVYGTSVVFNDTSGSPDGWVVMKDIYDGAAEDHIYGPGVWAGPDIDSGSVAWQNAGSQVCRRSLVDGAERCVVSTQASSLVLSGSIAVTGESGGGSTISRINFETGRSKVIDSYASPGMRFDPDLDGDQAVWIKMRGYGSQYYEPLVVSYDVSADTWSYLTLTGGGTSTGGESRYQRAKPSISGGRVLYQQRLNETGELWDIYEAVPDTFGVPVVEAPGNQVNPSLSGDLLVYQDDRSGHFDDAGQWVGDWDIYVRDLNSSAEQPLCTAPGDQINPEIKGDVVVWQDNRGGDWDIYAAVLSATGAVAEPDLALSIGSVYWDSYAGFLAGELTALYRITNNGPGTASEVAVQQIVNTPDTVTVAGGLPASVAVLETGQSGEIVVRYQVPAGISHFRTALLASCLDPGGNRMWFPAPPPSGF